MKRTFLLLFSFLGVLFLFGIQSASAATTSAPNCSLSGLYGSYYYLPATHPDVGNGARPASENVLPQDLNWFSTSYFVFSSNDALSSFSLPQTDEARFPDPNRLPGSPQYYAVHWSGLLTAPEKGNYRVTLSSHEDSWLLLNGAVAIHVPSNAEFGGRIEMLHLPAGTSTIDIFFAKRSDFQTGIIFRIDGGVTFSPCGGSALGGASLHGGTTLLQKSETLLDTIAIAPSRASNTMLPGSEKIKFIALSTQRTAKAGQYNVYQVEARHVDGALLSYTLLRKPAGMFIVPSTGFMVWRPTGKDSRVARHTIVVKASDGQSSAMLSFTITVNSPVTNSVLSQNINNKTVNGDHAAGASTPQVPASASNVSTSLSYHDVETTSHAGGRSLATVLFAGVFTLTSWLRAYGKSVLYFLIFWVGIALVAYSALEAVDAIKSKSRALVAQKTENREAMLARVIEQRADEASTN